MTLEEAIEHAEEVASRKFDDRVHCIKCAEEHRQLAEWLKDYKRLLEQDPCSNCCNGNQIEKAKLCQKSYLAGMEHKQEPMRDFTEEAKAYSKALDKMHKPTGFNVFNEPSGDLISREAVGEIKELMTDISGDTVYAVRMSYLRQLPPVKQEPKTGHWIMPVQDDGMSDPIYYQVRCSECGFDLDPQTWHMELHQYGADKYCPSCGARMVEQESEDKK